MDASLDFWSTCCPRSTAEVPILALRRLLSRLGESADDITALLQRIEERGSAYLPQVNAFYVRDFQMMYIAEEAARFLHDACRGLPRTQQIEAGP